MSSASSRHVRTEAEMPESNCNRADRDMNQAGFPQVLQNRDTELEKPECIIGWRKPIEEAFWVFWQADLTSQQRT